MHRSQTVWLLLACAFSLSVGWGIRGNFGHETGALIPGALAALAGVLLARREDWLPRVAYFAFFGALGWSFGGSISYMQVIGYTHSGHSPSVLYGFACLFIIGFLWAGLGGAGTALPAVATREQLSSFFLPLILIFGAWLLQDLLIYWFIDIDPAFRQRDPLYWYDTDWLGVLVALIVTLLLAAVRRGWDFATSLIGHMCAGWWAGFLLLVVALDWRMTPPRGDNWAGCLGMAGGLFFFLARRKQSHLLFSSLLAGTIGGFGFAFAQCLKLLGIKTGWNTNWHSLLEQSYGLMNGLGIGLVFIVLALRTRPLSDEQKPPPWTNYYCWGFVLLGITWLNFKKNPGTWVKAKAVPEVMHHIPAETWFHLACLLLLATFLAAVWLHQKRSVPFLPSNHLGRAQLLFILFTFWVLIGNFERALVSFTAVRLVTEGVIFLNAILTISLVLVGTSIPAKSAPLSASLPWRSLSRWSVVLLAFATLGCWGIIRLAYGNEFAGHSGKHIRFGPDSTATKSAPPAHQPHP